MSCTTSNADFRPAQYNIQIWRNDTWSNTIALFTGTTPINLTGATVEIQVRKTPSGETAYLTLTNGSGITIGGTNHNEVYINALVGIAAGSYVYDMAVQFADLTEKTYVWGTFIVYEDVTKL
jgi:hypothetical protein